MSAQSEVNHMEMIPFEGAGFRILKPSDWYATATARFAALFLQSTEPDQISPNLAVTAKPVEAGVEADALVEAAIEQQQASYPKYKLLANETVEVGGKTAQLIAYTWFNPEANVHVWQQQLVVIADDIAYSVVTTHFDAAASPTGDLLQTMLYSFELTG
jgi:hypothetical protein